MLHKSWKSDTHHLQELFRVHRRVSHHGFSQELKNPRRLIWSCQDHTQAPGAWAWSDEMAGWCLRGYITGSQRVFWEEGSCCCFFLMTTHPSIVNQGRILEPKIQWKKSIFQTLRSRGWSDIHAQPIQNHRIIKGCKSQEIHSFMHSNISPELYHILETNTFLGFLYSSRYPPLQAYELRSSLPGLQNVTIWRQRL